MKHITIARYEELLKTRFDKMDDTDFLDFFSGMILFENATLLTDSQFVKLYQEFYPEIENGLPSSFWMVDYSFEPPRLYCPKWLKKSG